MKTRTIRKMRKPRRQTVIKMEIKTENNQLRKSQSCPSQSRVLSNWFSTSIWWTSRWSKSGTTSARCLSVSWANKVSRRVTRLWNSFMTKSREETDKLKSSDWPMIFTLTFRMTLDLQTWPTTFLTTNRRSSWKSKCLSHWRKSRWRQPYWTKPKLMTTNLTLITPNLIGTSSRWIGTLPNSRLSTITCLRPMADTTLPILWNLLISSGFQVICRLHATPRTFTIKSCSGTGADWLILWVFWVRDWE